MKTYTHPDGRTATVQRHPHDSGVLLTQDTPAGAATPVVNEKHESFDRAWHCLNLRGFLDDQYEDAERWRFLKRAAIAGSPEADLMETIVAEIDLELDDDSSLTEQLAMDTLQRCIDKARKQLACQ